MARTVGRARADLTAATAQTMVPFPASQPAQDQPEAGTVPVVAHLDPASEGFEKQRQAARRALTFRPRTQTWHGELSRAFHVEPHRWQALIDATDAGGVHRVLTCAMSTCVYPWRCRFW